MNDAQDLSTLSLAGHYWGSVNTWECDENAHQNVRFFANKVEQALRSWVMANTGTHGLGAQVPGAIRRHHIRFLREARAATPVRVDVGLVLPLPTEQQRGTSPDGHTPAQNNPDLTLLSVMRHSATGDALAAFLTQLDLSALDAKPDTIRSLAADAKARPPAPAWAQPRGLTLPLPAPPQSLDHALAVGFRVVGQGVISPEECSAAGTAQPWVYIGRISDGMPNLWVLMNDAGDRAARESGQMGGAALEYHMEIVEPLAANDVYVHLAGVRSVGEKTQTMAHIMMNTRTGACAAQAGAVGVAMDLTTRKAVAIPETRRARLQTMLLRA
jgi:acyl-CoA thioester hydrolase